MKNQVILLFGLVLAFSITSCRKGSDIAYIDKDKKAIISTHGDPFKKVVITGGGKDVTFQSYDKTDNNSIIYFDRINPGFVVSEGFALEQNYILKLSPNKKYTVYIFKNPQDQAA